MRGLVYTIGNLRARLLGATLSDNCIVHPSVLLRKPTSIFVGAGSEVRRNVILDARGELDRAITIGAHSKIKDNVSIMCYRGFFVCGDDTLIQRNTTIFCHGGVEIGSGVLIAPNVVFAGARYALNEGPVPFTKQGYKASPIAVSDNVYLGSGVVVCSGARISRDVVVGANSVVTRDLDKPGLYLGAPARYVRPLAPVTGEHFDLPNWGR